MLRIAVCEDDPAACQIIAASVQRALAAEAQPYDIKLYSRGKVLLADVEDRECVFDILLLDIEMPDISGLKVSARAGALLPDAVQIFITDHMRYVLDAFALPTFRYIPKSQLDQRLPRALHDALEAIDRTVRRQIVLKRGDRLVSVPLSHIMYVTREGKNAVFHTAEDTERVRTTLSQVLADLDDAFILLDRGIIVNLAMISAIQGNEAVLTNGERLPISRRRSGEVRRRLTAYWGRAL